MEVQNQLIQSRWSIKRSEYLKRIFDDISTSRTPGIVFTDSTINTNRRSLYNEHEQKIDQNFKFKHKNTMNLKNPFRFAGFFVENVRSHTVFENLNFKNENKNTCHIQRLLKATKNDDIYDPYLKRLQNSYSLHLNSQTNQTLKLVSDDTLLSIKSASTLRSQVRKITCDETVKNKNTSTYNNNDDDKQSIRSCVRRKTVHITLQYETDKFQVNTKMKRFSPDKTFDLVKRFKKAVKKLLIVINVITKFKQEYDKNSNEVMTIFKPSNINGQIKDLVFDKNTFKRTNEKTLPEDIKNVLRMDHESRNEDHIRLALTAINQIVPEFEEFPQQIQKSFVKYGFYEEYEPGRIILREGHIASSCYFIISGTVMVTAVSNDDLTGEIKNRPISFLKRGNTFGDNALINNSRRTNTFISHGDYVIGLLSIFKEDFFKFSTPNFEDKKFFLNSQVPIFNMINYPVDNLSIISDKSCNTVYYKKGTIISDNSVTDGWIYVVKSGKCRVIKTITINEVARKRHYNLSHKREQKFLRVLQVNENILQDKTFENSSKKEKPSLESIKRLEIECLKEGDIFGIRDIIFSDLFNINPVTLLSDGAECILIDRQQFKKNLNEVSLGILKISVMPYPDEEYLLRKYFDKEDWNGFKKTNFNYAIRKMKLTK